MSVGTYSDEVVREFRGRGHWRDLSVTAHLDRWARAEKTALAVVDEAGSLTIGDLADRSRRLASTLAALGVGPGDRVLVQLPNQCEAFIVVHAVARLGAVAVFAQVALRDAEVGSALDRTGAIVIVTVDQHRGYEHGAAAVRLAASAGGGCATIVVGEPVAGGIGYDLALSAEPARAGGGNADDPFCIIFTSGTTAFPKGCVHTSNTLLFSARTVGAAMGLGPSDVMFMPSPLMHSTGLAIGILAPLVHRIPSVLQSTWDAERALDIVGRHACTATLGATAFGTSMLEAFDPSRHDLTTFRTFALAGAPIPSPVVRRLQETFSCRVIAAYGSTEALVATASRRGDSPDRIATTDGAPVDGVDVGIVDDDRRPMPPGIEGEIRVRTPGRFVTYWRDPQRVAETVDADRWFYTGDLGRIDEDGYLRITGRKADIIIRGGMNISAAEVESLLVDHPAVAEVAIVSMPDERLGERSCAYVVTRGPGPTLSSITTFLEQRGVATFKWPERLEIVPVLPRTATGKVEKWRLREDVRDRLRDE